MASTYSTNLKIELIGTGEQVGSWGSTTNTNLGTALEQAIVGKADVTMSSTTITLTLSNSNAAQDARAIYLNLTGSPGGAAALEVPAVQKPYIVKNGSNQVVTVKVTGQTGVAVPVGKTMWLYNDGTDVVNALNNLASGTTIAGASIGDASLAGIQTFTGRKTFNGGSFFVTGNVGTPIVAGGAAIVSTWPGNFLGRAYFEGSGGEIGAGFFNGNSNGVAMVSAINATNGKFVNFNYGAIAGGSTNVIGSITTTGGTAVVYNTSSDYRLKQDVSTISEAIARINNLYPVRFRWKANPDFGYVDGFLAHEVSPIVPESITGVKDEVDEKGKIVAQGIDQSKLVPLLVAAVKELSATVSSLESRILALEAK